MASLITTGMSAFSSRIFLTFARAWHGLEQLGRRVRQRLRRQQKQLRAEARQLGLQLLDAIDDLPFVPTLVRIRPVANQYYGHGAFMGAAPALLADERWRSILAFLMPDVYVQVDEALKEGAQNAALIPMFENNPVMCAFGCWHGLERRKSAGGPVRPAGDLSGMEWDLFVESVAVEEWESVPPSDLPAREALVDTIVERMIIAHASTADTVQENAGVCQYADVRRTLKTRMGGVEAPAWMDLFTRALRLASAPDTRSAIDRMSTEPRAEGPNGGPVDECVRHTFARPIPMADAVREYAALAASRGVAGGGGRFSVVLEMKTLRSTPEFFAAVVRALNRRGVHVVAVCSFSEDEIRGVSAHAQRVGAELLPGPRQIRFFHYAGDLQLACDLGQVAPGQGVLFNGATLLRHLPDGVPHYEPIDAVVEALGEYRERFGLDIGVYVQEGDCDAEAAGVLSATVADHPATFGLGFAWGGLLDEAHIPADGSDRRGLGSQAMLGMIGRARNWELVERG